MGMVDFDELHAGRVAIMASLEVPLVTFVS